MRKLRNTLAAISILLLASCGGNKDYYMFTSFHEPADEGLRYLYSEDGMHWDSIPGVWLKPELGQHRLMRDPSMVRTPDGTYHLVWTTSWKGDLGFGSLVGATNDSRDGRRTDHCQCMGSGDFL